jgi:hypothetical protein
MDEKVAMEFIMTSLSGFRFLVDLLNPPSVSKNPATIVELFVDCLGGSETPAIVRTCLRTIRDRWSG